MGKLGDFKNMTLRERFDCRGLGVSKYAKAYKLSQPILSNVLNGKEEITGLRRTKKGTVRKIFSQLKKDGIYIGSLPWEEKAC